MAADYICYPLGYTRGQKTEGCHQNKVSLSRVQPQGHLAFTAKNGGLYTTGFTCGIPVCHYFQLIEIRLRTALINF